MNDDVSAKFKFFVLGDAMDVHRNSIRFSTHDRDQDEYDVKNCAETYEGGWWYTDCHHANPNGLYLGGTTDQFATGVVWRQWRGYYYSLKKMEIKIRKNND